MAAINPRNKGAPAEREFSNIIFQWSGIYVSAGVMRHRS
jgi:hypothetical protein